jgi:hypothetical protein
MSLAINVWKKFKCEQLQVKDSLDLHVTLFNTTKMSNKGYTFRKHEENYDQLTPEEIKPLDLFESWCLFIYHLLHMNRLVLLSGVTSYVYDKSDTMTKPLLFWMGYTGDNQDVILEYLTWQKTNHIQIPSYLGPLTYQCKINRRAYTVISAPHRPFQFTLGELSSMLTIYDNKGDGWSTFNHRKYFWSDNPRDDDQVQPLMTTLHQYEENMILLSTMYEIKKIVLKKNHRKFWIKCIMKNYKQGKIAICKRHKTLFKDTVNNQYNFPANNELVITLSYQFVDSLNSGVWQKLPSPWLNWIQRKIKNAQNNSIQRIQVIRLLGTKDVLPGNDMVNYLPAINECYIYKIYMDKSRFYVNYGQISNIIGDEPWMKSEVHCLSNLSSIEY